MINDQEQTVGYGYDELKDIDYDLFDIEEDIDLDHE